MLLNTSLIRCSRASSSACNSSHSGVPRFGHGLVDRAVEPVMSPALVGTAGCVLGVGTPGSGDTLWLTRCGRSASAAIASCRDAQPQRLAPIPINRRAVSNRIIGHTIRRACGDTFELRVHPHILERGQGCCRAAGARARRSKSSRGRRCRKQSGCHLGAFVAKRRKGLSQKSGAILHRITPINRRELDQLVHGSIR